MWRDVRCGFIGVFWLPLFFLSEFLIRQLDGSENNDGLYNQQCQVMRAGYHTCERTETIALARRESVSTGDMKAVQYARFPKS